MNEVKSDPFQDACITGDITTVATLLSPPTSVDPSEYNNWALQLASYYGKVEIVRLLLEDPRVDPSAENNQATRWAKQNGYTEIVQLFIEHRFRLDGPIYNQNII